MPKVGNYRANSVIYFSGDVISDKVFVLQKGKVSLNYSDIETAKEIREIIQTGEFFGVKSALGKYPREENASSRMPRSSYSPCPSSRSSPRPRPASS
jgi:CRP-like cAMP-binding protein